MTLEIYDFIQKMVEIYGVWSFLDNDDEVEDMWFECPECGEPILIPADWSLEEVRTHCPICECEWETDF